MAGLLRQTVAVARGTGGGIAHAAGGEDDRIRFDFFTVFHFYAHGAAVFRQQMGDARVQPHGDAKARKFARERIGYVAGLVRSRKDALAALGFERKAEAFQQFHDAEIVQRRQRGVKEARIAKDMAHEGFRIAGVGEVAAAFAGDVDFFAQLFIAFQKRRARAAARGKQRGHQSRCAAADNEH